MDIRTLLTSFGKRATGYLNWVNAALPRCWWFAHQHPTGETFKGEGRRRRRPEAMAQPVVGPTVVVVEPVVLVVDAGEPGRLLATVTPFGSLVVTLHALTSSSRVD